MTLAARSSISLLAAGATIVALTVALSAPSRAASANVVRTTLANGLRVIVVRQSIAPVAAVNVSYDVGSEDAPSSDPALNDVVAAMMSKHVDGLSEAQLLQLTGALGGRSSHDVSRFSSRFYAVVPALDVDAALRIEAARMRGFGVVTPAEWLVERSVTAQTSALVEEGYEHSWREHLLAEFLAKPSSLSDPYANVQSLLHESLAAAQRFRETWYVPNNALLVVAGDVDPADIVAKATAYFGSIPRHAVPAAAAEAFQPPRETSTTVSATIVTLPAYACWKEPGPDSRDFAAAQVLDDIVALKSGGLSSLVTGGDALTVSFQQLFLHRTAEVSCARADVSGGANSKAIAGKLRGILRSYAAQGVSDEAVTAAKQEEALSRAIDATNALATARSWALFVDTLGFDAPDDYYAQIHAVTPADVDRVAREAFDPRDIADAWTVEVQPKLSAVASPPPATASLGSSVLPNWAASSVSSLQSKPASLNPSDVTLPNGLRLITVQVPDSGYVRVTGGVNVVPMMEAPPGMEGVDLVLDRLFRDGPADMSAPDFARAVDAIGGRESAGATFSVDVLPADFDRGVQLLADNELHPTFTASAFASAQNEARDDAADRLRSVGAEISLFLARTLYSPTDPEGRIATPDSVAALTVDDVRAYYESAFRSDRTTIVVVGNVTADQSAAVVTKWFGGWVKSTEPAPELNPPAVPPNKPATQFYPAPQIRLRVSLLGETLDVTPSSLDMEALEAGIEALGGTSWDSMLTRDVRDRSGLAVFITDSLSVSATRSTLSISYVGTPANSSRIRTIVTNDITALQTAGPGAGDLAAIKALMIRQQILSMSDPATIASSYVSFSNDGLPLDEPQIRAQRYAALSADDVRSTFKRLVRVDGFIDLEFGAQ